MSTDSYYDLDAILGEEQRVPTTFKVSAAQLGHFMPGNEVQQIEDLPKDTRLELPLWLSKILLERNMVALDMPPFYGSRNRSRLKADEWSINIRDKSPYYFRVGRTLSKVNRPVLFYFVCASFRIQRRLYEISQPPLVSPCAILILSSLLRAFR